MAQALDKNIRGRLIAFAESDVQNQFRAPLDSDKAIAIAFALLSKSRKTD